MWIDLALYLGFQNRVTAFVHAFPSVGTHTLKIVVVGTAGHPKVSVDAFAVSQR